MKKREVFGAMQGLGLAGAILGVCGYISNLKKLGQADSEVEVETRVKNVKMFGTLAGVSGAVAGTGLALDSLTVDKMSVEEMEEIEKRVRSEVARELEEDDDEEIEEQPIIDDSDIEV